MASAYSTLPAKAKLAPSRFTAHASDEQLADFHQLLKLSKIAPETYEGLQTDRRFGITTNWLTEAKAAWENFNWRACEAHINSFPNFTVPIKEGGDEFDIHFVALFSKKEDAVPLLMLHGWPGSFMEFLPIMKILKNEFNEEILPYHVVVPSLPGYAYSSKPPLHRDFRLENVANVVNDLMIGLGFGDGYVVQGGDIGSKVGRVLGALHPEVKAVHLNFCIMSKPDAVDPADVNEGERIGWVRAKEFERIGSAYAIEHATRPATIGMVLATSPLALLAWIGEKFLQWTDEDPPLATILESVTLYWLTESFPTSIYPYRQLFTPGYVTAHDKLGYLDKPFGFSWFPYEIAPIPRSWAATTGNLVFYRQHEQGGHFAAVEQPDVLLADVVAFVDQVWKK